MVGETADQKVILTCEAWLHAIALHHETRRREQACQLVHPWKVKKRVQEPAEPMALLAVAS